MSIVVQSVMNSIEPPGSAEISQMANKRCGRVGEPILPAIHGVDAGRNKYLASGMVKSLGEFTAQ